MKYSTAQIRLYGVPLFPFGKPCGSPLQYLSL
jgi:hypothetical protein